MKKILLLAAIFLVGCGTDNPEQNALPEVIIQIPETRKIVDWDEYTGQFEAVESVEVRARVSGYLQKLHFRQGSIIRRGQLLVTIDPRPFQAELAQAKAAVQGALTRRDLAKADLERAELLLSEQAISQEEYDARLQARQESLTSVAAARAALRQAELNLQFTSVRSPIAGRVGARLVTVGNLVSGGGPTSTLLTTVYSVSPMHFSFTANEAAYLKYVRQNAEGSRPSSREEANPVRLRLQDESDFVHEGRMNFVDNEINGNSGTVQGQAIFDNPAGLFIPGMFGRIQLLGSGEYDALLVPDSAILADQSNKIIMVVGDNDEVAARTVELGPVLDDGMRVIRDGISNSDRVVVGGLMRVRPGDKVSPKRKRPSKKTVEPVAKEQADTATSAESSGS